MFFFHANTQKWHHTVIQHRYLTQNWPSNGKLPTTNAFTTRYTLLGGALALLPTFGTMILSQICFQSPAKTTFDKSSNTDQSPTNQQPLDNGLPPLNNLYRSTTSVLCRAAVDTAAMTGPQRVSGYSNCRLPRVTLAAARMGVAAPQYTTAQL